MPRKLLGQHGYHRHVMQRAEAVDLLRRLHQAQQAFFAGGDEAPVRALLTDDIHWHVPGHNAIAGDYQGIDAVLAYFRRRRDLVDRTFRLHPGDVLVGDGDRVPPWDNRAAPRPPNSRSASASPLKSEFGKESFRTAAVPSAWRAGAT